MLLNERLQHQGNWLFRRRGYLPFLVVPLVIVAGLDSAYFVDVYGEKVEEFWEVFCLMISLLGLAVRAFTIGFVPSGTSGRNTAGQRADTLNTTGPYSVVRNPLYLGNWIVFLGFILAIKVWWFVLVAGLLFAIYYERIVIAEETYLRQKFAAQYTEWASRTPAFLPNPSLWHAPALAFSIRNVLRREYNGLFVIVAFFTVNEIAYDLLIERESVREWLDDDSGWLVFFAVGAAIFLLLRTLKRHTRLLTVAGR